MYPTTIDLAESIRTAMIPLLNSRLADAIDLHLQAKQAHWNVKGPNFIALHELFDATAEEAEDFIDDIAERITALGGIAEGTLPAIIGRTKLPAYDLKLSRGKDHVMALAKAVGTFGKLARLAIDEAAAKGDADTADLFTGISRGLDKRLWFLEAHLHADG